jgi:radical SAM-linked protein
VTRQRLHVIFRKGEGTRFLSHLDLQSTLEFSMRRAHLPLEFSEGFSPRPKMSLVSPLPLGYTGEREVLEITLHQSVPPQEVLSRLQAAVPEGITIREVLEVPAEGKSAASKLLSAAYQVVLPDPVPDLVARLTELLDRPHIEVEEERDRSIRRRDIRPAILALEADGERCFHLTAAYDGGTVRPEQILDLLGLPHDGARISRTEITVATTK